MASDAAAGAASASSALAMTGGGGGASAGDPRHMGPGLAPGMSDTEVFERLNAWGISRDGDLRDISDNLAQTQATVAATFEQARSALLAIIIDFRGEAEMMRQNSYAEAAQGLARLELVVTEARGRFEAQEARFTRDLHELGRRQQAVETFVQAAPAPAVTLPPTLPRTMTSPGGTVLSFYPGGPADGALQPMAPAASGFSTPPPRSAQHDAWGPWAAGRGVSPQGQPSQRHDARTAADTAQQRPQPQSDAWAGAAAARQQAPQQPGEPARHSIFTPGGGDSGKPREMRLDARGWAVSQPKLDVGMPVDGFQVWKDRASMFLSRERPDVRKLLGWAETQSKETLRDGIDAQAASLGIDDLAGVEYALHDGIKVTITDALLGRARNCVGCGCELWRALCAEWSGAAPQLQHAKARRYQDPPTCKNVAELWTKLPAWERLGEEVALSGLAVPSWLAMSALEQLLPAALRDALVARASCGDELSTFTARLAWVKVQMEHARGLAQASAYAPGGGGRGKDANGDVNMYVVADPPGLGHDAVEGMTWALAEAAHAGDWGLAESLQQSIFAMKGGKGGYRKGGLGKGKPGKGGASPAAKGEGAGADQFQGTCNHCGIWGHRRSECRKLTAELGKAGPKGKAGGKGGPAGGKGPAPPIAELGADDGWAGDLLNEAVAGAASEFDEWNFGAALCSVTAATECCMGPWSHASRRRRGPRLSVARALGPVPVGSAQQNRFEDFGANQPHGVNPQDFGANQPHGVNPQDFGANQPHGVNPQDFGANQPHGLNPQDFGANPAAASASGLAAGTPAIATKNSFAALSLLTDGADELLASVSTGGAHGGRVIEAIVDSGAVHSVTPPGLFPGPTAASPWSLAGRGYRAANGSPIANLGQIAVKFSTAEGDRCAIPFQVAAVEQPLLSVAHLAAAGNRVELGHDSGRVVNLATGRSIALERRGGVYIMRMYLAGGAPPAPFRRQA
jgi:hypothetical protein